MLYLAHFPALRSPELRRVSYLVTSRGAVDEAVGALANVPGLQTLELIIKNCTLCSDQLRQIGERGRWGRRDERRGWAGWVRWVVVGPGRNWGCGRRARGGTD